jgi:hypothetical protein
MGNTISNEKYQSEEKGENKETQESLHIRCPPVLLDAYCSSKTWTKEELRDELLKTPANMLGINLMYVEPTDVKFYDEEDAIKKIIGSYTLTLPTDILMRYEQIPEYKKMEWIKLLTFPCGEFIIIKYKPNYYSHLEYMIGQLGEYPLIMYFPPNFTHVSTIRMITMNHFNRVNAIAVCQRLFTEHTSHSRLHNVSLTQPVKLWKGGYDMWYSSKQEYLGTFPLLILQESSSYNPFLHFS